MGGRLKKTMIKPAISIGVINLVILLMPCLTKVFSLLKPVSVIRKKANQFKAIIINELNVSKSELPSKISKNKKKSIIPKKNNGNARVSNACLLIFTIKLSILYEYLVRLYIIL